jgi:branched-chain amino acid transport system substrate-binding protein
MIGGRRGAASSPDFARARVRVDACRSVAIKGEGIAKKRRQAKQVAVPRRGDQMTRAAYRLFAIAIFVGLIAAGCGSSSKKTAATPPSSSGSTATASPIVIGTIGSFTGPLASSPDTDRPVLNAWIQWTNSNGGINGHPVKLIALDDDSSATTAVADFQQLQADHVVAIVNETSLGDVDWAPLAQKAQLPVIGGNAVQIPYVTSSDFYASGTNIFAAIYGDMELAKRYGPKLAILPCTESATCADSVALYKAIGPTVGVSVVFNQAIAASTPDFTAVCQALKASGAESYVVVDATPIIARVANSCRQQNVTAKLIESSGADGPTLLTAPGADGLLAAEVDFPFVSDSTPAEQQFHSVMQKYAPADLADQPATTVPWVAMQLFGEVAKKVGSAPVTSQSLIQALGTIKDDTLGGLAPPLSFTIGQVNLADCYFVLGISGGKYVAPMGDSPQCAPSALVNSIAKAVLSKAA